ncbi:pilus assembly protein N-terminal domain-containing protein [Stieleria sp. ICT_E10.1]|uniref:pilus assembly protein N-terminal domain-containing protein n=1 Tax=Stieleria sedimenti TaxID=2976331 RepID=UPI00217F4D80|nr:pilus assembly protein N-terminal domain-containing protein [Stieleria sedimenti]MCS7465655.1 pilus assembly protein N-terminal domain-containing protein [Stieleria sedimenti]
MRVNNAKLTSQNGDPSKRIAKRAVLVAVLVASGSTAGGQQPQGGMIQSRFFNQNNATPGIVHGGARTAAPMPVGAVQSNPFVAPGQAPTTPANGAVQSATMAGGHPSMAASPVGRVRQNPRFHAASATGVSDRPLIALRSSEHVPATQVEAFDRFGPVPADAFVQPNQPDQAQLSWAAKTAAMNSPAPLAIPTGAATPIRSASASDATSRLNEGHNAPIGIVAEQDSRVIPVADARDEQTPVQETQPIFFTLSDDTAEAGDAFTSEFELDGESTPSVQEPAEQPMQTDPKTEPAAPEPKTPEPETPEPEASPPATPPVAVETPVKLAPAVNFAPEALAPLGDDAVVKAKTMAPSDVDEDQADDSGIDELVVSNRARVPLTAKSRVINTEQHVAPQADSQIPVLLQRKTVAIATPPVELQFGASDDAVVQSTIDPIRFEPAPAARQDESATDRPTTAAVGAENSGSVEDAETPLVPKAAVVRTLEHRSKEVQNAAPIGSIVEPKRDAMEELSRRDPAASRTPLNQPVASQPTASQPTASQSELRALPPQVGGHAIVTSVAPGIEQIGTDEAPLIAAPVAVNPSHVGSPRTATVQPPNRTAMSSTRARLASSRHSIMRRSIEPEQKRIDVTVPDPNKSLSQGAQGDDSDGKRPAVVLQLTRAQVRSMTIGGRVRRFTIENKDVCQAFASSANQIKLIGTGTGQTELTIWADVAEGEPTRKQTFRIQVSEGVDAIGDKVAAHTELLNDSIDQAFPTASVVVSLRGGELVVTGHCDDEDTAKQIVRMVRKSCLVPVQDNLKVR